MKLSPNTVAELQSEAKSRRGRLAEIAKQKESLTVEEKEINEDLAAILKLLPDEKGDQVLTTIGWFPHDALTLSSKNKFRDNLRAALKHSDHPLKATGVRQLFENAGLENPGTTNYTIRIGNELYKLASGSDPHVKKVTAGYIWVENKSVE